MMGTTEKQNDNGRGGWSTKRSNELPRGIYEKIPGSGVYWIRYADTHGVIRREKGGTGTLRAAVKRLELRKGERAKGDEPVKQPRNVTFGSLIDDTLSVIEAEAPESSNLSVRKYMLAIIREKFGNTPVRAMTPPVIQAWLHEQRKPKAQGGRGWKSGSVYNRYHSQFSRVFHVAMDSGKVTSNPASKVTKAREDNSRVRFLSLDEERRLTAAIAERFPEYMPVFVLAMHTGMRLSEQLRGVVGDYSPATELLTVHQYKDKHASMVRHVPLSTDEAVAAYHELAAGKDAGEKLHTKTKEFRRGEGLEMIQVHYWFDQCVAAAGIANFHWHDLRHTFASRMVTGGVPLRTVADYMGHSSMEMTMRYSHLQPADHDKAKEAMRAFYGKVKPAKVARAKAKATGTFGVIRGGRR